MNPEFIKEQIAKLREQGFEEELIVSKHKDGRVSILTHIPGSVEHETVIDAYMNGVDLITSVVLSMSKLYAAPGQDRVLLDVFMKHLVERVREARTMRFQMGIRPTVEPGLESGFKNDTKEQGDQ